MHEQNERVCYEIINEVSNKLLEEGSAYDLDRELIYSIQNDWVKNLEVLQSIPLQNRTNLIELPETYYLNGSCSEDFSEEEYINKLEENIGVYMVCFYTKVTRSKVKWKCNFKNGFINLDKEDIPYSNASGELIQW